MRALVVDERARVVDVAYRELTQHFPRPGWVEHDPDEIWAPVRATLAEVAGRLADRGHRGGRHRDHQPARDGGGLGPVDRATRCTGPSCGRTGGPPRGATSSRRAGHLPSGPRSGPAWSSTPTSRRRRWSGSSVRAGWRRRRTRPRPRHGRRLGALEPHRRGRRRACFATDATNAARTMLFDIATRRWSDELCDLFGVPAAALPEVRPSCGRFGAGRCGGLGAGSARSPACRSAGVAGDQQAALFGQACFEPGHDQGHLRDRQLRADERRPGCPPPSTACVTTVAWDLGEHADGAPAGGLRPRGVGVRLRGRRPVAARRARAHRRGRRDRTAGRVGRRQRAA